MSAPSIALVTCAALPDLDPDDRLLADALAARGVAWEAVVWDDPEADWTAHDLVLLRSPWDYYERRDAFVAWAERTTRVADLRNPAATIAWNTDKTYLRRLAEAGVPTVPTVWAGRGASVDLAGELATRGWREAIVKPTVGAGSSGLLRIADASVGAAAAQAHLDALLRDGDAMIQPFLASLPAEGEVSVIAYRGEVSHVVRKRPPAGEFRVQPDFGAITTQIEPTSRQLEVAEAALATLGDAPLYARVDLVADKRGEPLVMELELVEPTLYFEPAPGSAERFADVLLDELAALRSS